MKRMKILNIKNMVDLKRCIEPIKSLLERKYVQYKIVLFFFFFFFMSNLNQNFILFLNSTNWNFQSRTTILRYLPHAQPVYTVHLNIQAGPTFEVWIVPPIFISQSDRPVVWPWKDFEYIFFTFRVECCNFLNLYGRCVLRYESFLTIRSKISSDHQRLFFDVSLYPFHFSRTLPLIQ